MKISEKQQQLLRMLPGVDHILEQSKTQAAFNDVPQTVLVNAIRTTIESYRTRILSGDSRLSEKALSDDFILNDVIHLVHKAMTPNLKRVVNATGVVVHTNLGRSLLAQDADEHLALIAGRYSNLEYDLEAGRRGSRYSSVEGIICEISGAEAAMVVNNNAAAVLLCLETFARDKKVIVSRGELVEIGGSFRIPDVMAKSGGILNEVGTTNRTHVRDYEDAIDEKTGLLLKVHCSNYSVVGFTAALSLKELVELGARHGIPVMEDLGSGTFIDFSKYGLTKEPTVQESVSTGADLITFSGDKLLGGPQAGIVVGKKDMIETVRSNPLTRALRIDKLTLAALEYTLRLYRDEEKAVTQIPTLRMLTSTRETIAHKAQRLERALKSIDDARLEISTIDRSSKAGGGALPLLELPSQCIRLKIQGLSANRVEKNMRHNNPPIIGRIEDDHFIIDMRTIQEEEFSIIEHAIANLLKRTA
ncbi:MAG: L-seryl-tRNA(Sec) selenium transferase [Deltaproteobacteria bacterium]|jgi:L-seryl-tRNA(Ser) seleniumtransferase|nr:L-seryl-tRNA(Sec) selenium transferase [Deltaproteobacteria bacterium]